MIRICLKYRGQVTPSGSNNIAFKECIYQMKSEEINQIRLMNNTTKYRVSNKWPGISMD